MNQRLFAFGCSFTRYCWPTWADIIGKQFNYYQNWGQPGAGNQYIFNSLVECHLKNQITPNDTVCIMWSNVSREDRYVKGQWVTPGNIYTQAVYDQKFIKTLTDTRGYYIRDLATIHATKLVLDQIGCRYIFLSMVPLRNPMQYEKADVSDKIGDLLEYYQSTVDLIRPSVFEVVFNNDWWSRPFLKKSTAMIEEKYKKNAGRDWPTFDNFVQKNFTGIKQEIIDEIFDKSRWNWEKDLHQTERKDTHPTPIEHLEYVQKILPEFQLTDETKNWCLEIDSLVRSEISLDQVWSEQRVSRW